MHLISLISAVLGLDRTDAHLRRVQTKSVQGQKLPQKYSSQAVAVPSWREFVRYLLLTDKLTYVSSISIVLEGLNVDVVLPTCSD